VDPQAFVPTERTIARRALGIPLDAEVVGFAGTFAMWQGCDTLVAGVASLAAARPRLHLLLIGDEGERPRLEALATPLGARAHFLGRLPHADIPRTLSACDVLAAPLPLSERNRRTGVSPIKLFEFFALARPVLASRIPGMEVVANRRLGALFSPGDPRALAERLATLLDLPQDERTAIGQRARVAACEHFTWDRAVEDIVAFVEGI
jgi:glycosyltransferase involved in cell wall biosynthesis